MNASGLIFSSVTAFELQPELSKRRVKRDDLDTLTEVYIGPAGQEEAFIPGSGSPHAQYNLMRLISVESKQMPGLLVQITLNYQGKLANGDSYTSIPTVSKSWMEGEVTYQVNGVGGIISYVRRYTGRCVELSYITNSVPTGEPTNVGLATGFLGFENVWETMSGFSAGVMILKQGSPINKMACTDVRVADNGDGWYKVTETYQSKMFPGDTGYQYSSPPHGAGEAPPPTQPVSATARNRLISSDTSGATNADQQSIAPYTVNSQTNVRATDSKGTAQRNADTHNATLDISPAGSVGADTSNRTGMDPSYGEVISWTTPDLDKLLAQSYPTISDDAAVPYSPDVGVTSQVYSG